ncbi:DUF397 domain-containing protein [Kibdelosporangium aridum]|uniref:DUF397 domain-containing protein n=1 Tax=Kibdelosporangium aridum TaxID=2030 RepID=UPI0035ED0FE3
MADNCWRKPSQSEGESNCVELVSTVDEVRDSKNPSVTLSVPRTSLATFLASLKR